MHIPLVRRLAVVLLLLTLSMMAVTPAAAAPTPCADLSITAMSTDPYEPIQNQPATVHISVHNGGTCASQDFVVQWQSDQFAPAGPSTTVDGIAAGATVDVQLQYAFPNAGNFLTVVNIDTGNAVSETNEVNNLEILPVTVVPATIDLQVTDISFSPSLPVATRVTTVTITVVNNGNTASGPFQVQWTPWLFESPLTKQVDALGAGATTTVTFDYTFWWAATFDGWATVDSGGWVLETDEFNNTLTKSVLVDPPLPDLIVDNFTINPASPVPGQIATATVTITNQGHANAGPFRVQWQPWWLTSPISVQVNGLAENASTNVTFKYVYPFSASFDGTVTVDSTNSVWEISDSNNTLQVQVPVGQNKIDLVITSMSITPASPTQGQNASVNITVKNQGNTPAGNFMVEFNPDSFFLYTPGMQTVSKQVFGLAAGASTTVNFQVTYPLAGNFRGLANVDAFSNIAETNESNNLKILNVTVQPAPIDLIVTGFTINPASPVRGVEATATITVKNNGPFPANDFAVEWLLSDSDDFGPVQFVNGLNPGESRTLTFDGTYYVTGTFTSQAIVDVYNMVVEPGAGAETNNTFNKTVTVVPQQTTLRVTLNSVNVSHAGEDGIDDNAEWDPMIFAVLDPTGTCNFGGQTINGVECQVFSDDAVEDGDTLNLNRSIDVTLEEFTPLVFAFGAYEDDEVIGIPLPGEIMGFAFQISFPPDYLTLGSVSIPGEQGESGCGASCFTANFTVTVLSSNVPASMMSMAAASTLPLDTQMVLDEFKGAAQLPTE